MGIFGSAQSAINAQVKPTASYLQAGIHNVKFVSVEKGSNEAFNTVDFTFEDANGAIHIERMFEPRSGERQPNRFNTSVEDPSQAEQFLAKIMHMMSAINPEMYRRIQAGEVKFDPSDFNVLVDCVKKIFNPKAGVELQIKLLPNGRFVGFPGFPAAIDKNGNLYLRTSFIGNDLTLSAWEKAAIDKAAQAKPTQMPSTDKSELDSLGLDNDFTTEDDADDLPF